MRLSNKVAIITGAGSGIGRASAILFAKEGATIVVADIHDGGGEETVSAIKATGGDACFIHTDVTMASEVENLMKLTKVRFGRIDILFNNAGVLHRAASVENLQESEWDRVFAVNVKGIFLAAKFAVPVMKEMGSGVIINLASIGGVRPRKDSAAYASSKAAAIHLTKALALELASCNIRVNAINPVAIDTPLLRQAHPADFEKHKKDLIDTIPLKRMPTPEDVAYTALFLASDDSAMLTGTSINVDGEEGSDDSLVSTWPGEGADPAGVLSKL